MKREFLTFMRFQNINSVSTTINIAHENVMTEPIRSIMAVRLQAAINLSFDPLTDVWQTNNTDRFNPRNQLLLLAQDYPHPLLNQYFEMLTLQKVSLLQA